MNSVIFFGTDEFAAHILGTLLDKGINVVAVVTKPDRAKKRNKKLLPPPVKEYLIQRGYDGPLFQPVKASTEEFEEILKAFAPDLFVVVSYGEIISQKLLDIPKILPMNIHPSMLPKYRGASPLRSALINGDKEIGIAIFEMVKAMDAGDVLAMESLSVEENENHSELEKRVFEKSGKMLLKLLQKLEGGKVEKTPQVGEPTFTKKFNKEDTLIDWSDSVYKILNRVRAFGDQPGAYCKVKIGDDEVFLKIIAASKLNDESSQNPTVKSFSKGEGWSVSVKDGTLQILKVQKQGKKIMQSQDFINGLRGQSPHLIAHS